MNACIHAMSWTQLKNSFVIEINSLPPPLSITSLRARYENLTDFGRFQVQNCGLRKNDGEQGLSL